MAEEENADQSACTRFRRSGAGQSRALWRLRSGCQQGWVSVGIDRDTAEFAVESIRRWWRQMGTPIYPKATRLLITADCGGSNGDRVRLWKVALQRFADETRITLQLRHLPPGTSKWNKIEHRMFCHITQNWRGNEQLRY